LRGANNALIGFEPFQILGVEEPRLVGRYGGIRARDANQLQPVGDNAIDISRLGEPQRLLVSRDRPASLLTEIPVRRAYVISEVGKRQLDFLALRLRQLHSAFGFLR
jgi:hypothetical protein